MAERRRYTRAQRATAVVAAELSSVAAAAEAQGIPERTLRHWRDKPELAELAAKTREDHADDFRVLMAQAVYRLIDLVPTMDARDLIILTGVAADKSQLLAGHATARLEHRELLNDFDDHEREAMTAWLRDLAKARINAG